MSSDAETSTQNGQTTETDENQIKTSNQKSCLPQQDNSRLSVNPISNGETENEADVSSLSSQDEGDGYKKLRTTENAIHRPNHRHRASIGDISDERSGRYVQATTQTEEETQASAIDENSKQSQEQINPLTPLTPVRAVLDLNDEALAASEENGYLEGVAVHEFHSSSPATVSCEMTTDVVRERGRSVAEVKELAFARLQEELQRAQEELKLKDEEVLRLSRVRTEVESELEELTACLFQEAHDMVRQASLKQANAEKMVKEANMKTEVLQAELKALKALVITSTPSRPNKHLHPHLEKKAEQEGGLSLLKGHRRSPSHNNLKYGRDLTPPGSPEKEVSEVPHSTDNNEVDPIFHREFVQWREKAEFNKSHPFLQRIYREEIEPCLTFTNNELGDKVRECVEKNAVIIEAVMGKPSFPKRCCLLDTPRLCKYRMKLGDDEEWYHISQLCRNRIASVCDFLSYLRYISQGLVRNSVHDVYWQIIRLRKEMALAKLGILS